MLTWWMCYMIKIIINWLWVRSTSPRTWLTSESACRISLPRCALFVWIFFNPQALWPQWYGVIHSLLHCVSKNDLKMFNFCSMCVCVVLLKITCAWWNTETRCIAANNWNGQRWVACAPSLKDRNRAWSIWNKVRMLLNPDTVVQMFFLSIWTHKCLFSHSPAAFVPFTHYWPEHQNPPSMWIPKCGQVQLYQQGLFMLN